MRMISRMTATAIRTTEIINKKNHENDQQNDRYSDKNGLNNKQINMRMINGMTATAIRMAEIINKKT